MFQRIINNKQGAVLILVALMLPIFLGIFALTIDLGYLYTNQAKLQSAVDLAANAGTAKIADLALEAAEKKEPGDSDNPFDYLEEGEIENIINDLKIENIVQSYCQKNFSSLNCSTETNLASQQITVQVSSDHTVNTLLPKFTEKNKKLTAKAISILPIN